MGTLKRTLVLLCALLAACGQGETPPSGDAAHVSGDTGRGSEDAGPDTGSPSPDTADAAAGDATKDATEDAQSDTGAAADAPDSGVPDSVAPDSVAPDTGAPDADAPDVAMSDVDGPDSGDDAAGDDAADAAPTDSVPSDVSSSDAATDATDVADAGDAGDAADSADAAVVLPGAVTCPHKPFKHADPTWKPAPLKGQPVPSVHCAKPGWASPSPKGQLSFTTVGQATGVPTSWFVDPCLAAGDYDGDGDVDLLAIRQPTTLAGDRQIVDLRNTHKQTGKLGFQVSQTPIQLGGKAHQCISADMDGDGDLDVVVAGGKSLIILRNDAGKWATVALPAFGSVPQFAPAIAVLDADLDGDLDLVTAPYLGAHPPPAPGSQCICKAAQDAPYTHCSGGVCTPAGNQLQLLHNTLAQSGKLGFTLAAVLPSVAGDMWSLSVHDLDRDGWPDVFAGAEWGGHGWLHNPGTSSFGLWGTSVGMRPYAHIMGSAVADFDRDGVLDLAVADYGADTLYRGAGDGTFTNGSKAAGLWAFGETAVAWSAVGVDLDQDGWQDLLMSTTLVPTPQTLHGPADFNVYKTIPGSGHVLRRNVGGALSGSWLPWAAGAKPHISPVGWAAADLDGDGDVDLLGTSFPGKLELYRNDTAQVGHWIGLRPKAKTSAPGGEGAWVFVWAGGHVIQRYLTHGVGHGADGPYRYRFGLGAALKPDLIRVRWPSGKISEIQPTQGDTWIVAQEP